LKKLISTSYAVESKNYKKGHYMTLFEKRSPNFDKKKTRINGKIFTLTRDESKKEKLDFYNLKWKYMEGDGDFRSDEVKKLRDEADIIITNPPFSLFREFLAWIIEANKKFVIIGNKNCITYKEVFPFIKNNKLWLGAKSISGSMFFKTSNKKYAFNVSSEHPEGSWWKKIDGETCIGIGTCWFTNLDHGRRHQPLELMTMNENLEYSEHKEIKGKKSYDKYDNYDAIEVPFTNAIPSDYEGVMGVPISFLDKYSPEQFEIVGWSRHNDCGMDGGYWKGGKTDATIDGREVYRRILIKHKNKR